MSHDQVLTVGTQYEQPAMKHTLFRNADQHNITPSTDTHVVYTAEARMMHIPPLPHWGRTP